MSKIKKRGNKSRLIRTISNRVTWKADLAPEYRQKDRAALEASFRTWNLESVLSSLQMKAEHILKTHNKPYTFPEYFDFAGNYKEDYQVSSAADILFSIHVVRELVQKGDTENVAFEAIKLGHHLAILSAEQAFDSKKEAIGKDGLNVRRNIAKERRGKFKKITDMLGYKEGDELDKKQKKRAREQFKGEYPEYKNEPSNQTLNNDLLEIGFKFKS